MNPTSFDAAFNKLLGHEGGYSMDVRDPGGETNWGISKRSYPDEDIANLTQARAKEIYKRDYWDKCQTDALPPELRYDVFDGAVNSGVGQSVKWLQQAVGETQDGQLGPRTLSACKYLPSSVIAAMYNGYRLLFMTDRNTWDVFGKGWARRIAKNLTGAV